MHRLAPHVFRGRSFLFNKYFPEDLQEIMLVIFKLSTHVNEKPTVKISEIGDPRVKRACFIMVDNWRDSNIVDCHVNDESFQDIVKFIEI